MPVDVAHRRFRSRDESDRLPYSKCAAPRRLARHCLFNNFDGTANRKIKLTVSATLIDSDFCKSVRVLVPECGARRPITEGPRALQQSTCHDQPCVARQHDRPKPTHRVAVMIDVNDLV